MEQIIDEKELFFTDLALKREIIQQARVRNFHQDHVITQPGDEIMFIPIVLSGCLRILRQNEDGQEVFLYH